MEQTGQVLVSLCFHLRTLLLFTASIYCRTREIYLKMVEQTPAALKLTIEFHGLEEEILRKYYADRVNAMLYHIQ